METYTCEIPARFRDINLAGHVDNVEAIRVLDEARLEFFRFAELPGLPAGRAGLLQAIDPGVEELVVSQHVNYFAEMRFVPFQPFRVTLWVSRIGTSSFSVNAEVRVSDRQDPAVAYACTTAMWQTGTQTAWPLSEAVRADLERYLGEPLTLR